MRPRSADRDPRPRSREAAVARGEAALPGVALDAHLVHLASRAAGGLGLVLTGATAVEPRGRISPQDLGLWADGHVDALRRVVAAIHDHGAAAGVQLAHAGRKAGTYRPWAPARGAVPDADGGWPVVGPTDAPFGPTLRTPTALAEEDLAGVVGAFADAAARADAAGFDVAEVHAAHGYLLHQFLSPLVNDRRDGYGGGFEERTRLLREVVAAVRAVWPDGKPLFVRVSASDWTPGGWTADDTVRLARELASVGVDLIDCSSGGAIPGVAIAAAPNFQVGFAERVRREAGVASAAVGRIVDPAQADAIVAEGRADLVLLGKQLLREPYWALRAAQELGAPAPWPDRYACAVGGRAVGGRAIGGPYSATRYQGSEDGRSATASASSVGPM
ncbi:MAG: oxidoreductase [Trueperaceae bacterium]|nr:oxidoreductase [Trueperaceae bacterium]